MFTPAITKEFVTEMIPEERIFEYYLNVPVVFNRNFPSPFRKEKAPSCRFVVGSSGSKDTIRMIDYGRENFNGDVFALVMKLFNTSFSGAVQKIAQDFGLTDEKTIATVASHQTYSKAFLAAQAHKDKQYAKIEVQIRKFNQEDIDFWAESGIGIEQLLKYQVFPCKTVLLNQNTYYFKRQGYPAYAYKLGDKRYKIYRPKEPKTKWLCNNSLMQGYKQLPETGDFLVITKSLKDVMFLDRIGIVAVAPPSETSLPSDEIMQNLIKRFKQIVIFYDWDKAGIVTAANFRRKYGLVPYFLTDGSFRTRNFKAKDATDLVKLEGYNYARDLILKAKEHAQAGHRIPLRSIRQKA